MNSTALPDPAARPSPVIDPPVNRWQILKNPWLCLIAVCCGAAIGEYHKPLALWLTPFGNTYLALLQMSLLPILPAAVIVSLARLLRAGQMARYLRRLILVFAVAVFMGSAIGLAAGTLCRPGENLGASSQAILGKALLESEHTGVEKAGIWEFISTMVPSNLFAAFSSTRYLAVIFVSLLMGVAVGQLDRKMGESFLSTLETVQAAFFKILGWTIYGLPFGLCCMIASQVAVLGTETIFAFGKFVVVFGLASLFLSSLYLAAMKLATGLPLGVILDAVKDPVMLAFSAASSVPAIPLAMERMHKLGLSRDMAGLVVPLGISVNRHSYPMLFALLAVSLSQLYGKPLDVGQCLLVLLTATIVGQAAIGRAAIIAPLVAYVLEPVGLPASVGTAILITLSPVIDPLVQGNVVLGSCATAVVIGKNSQKAEAVAAPGPPVVEAVSP